MLHVQFATFSMPTSAKTNTNFLDASFDALVRQDFIAIDKQLSLLVNLHAVMRQLLHDSLGKWTVRRAIAPPVGPAIAFRFLSSDIHAIGNLGLAGI